jgi:hypothetical protein
LDARFLNVILNTFSIAQSYFVFVWYNSNIVAYYKYFVLQSAQSF